VLVDADNRSMERDGSKRLEADQAPLPRKAAGF
jgi:hypothetical protein